MELFRALVLLRKQKFLLITANIYGGEITLLPEKTLKGYLRAIYLAGIRNVSLTSNLHSKDSLQKLSQLVVWAERVFPRMKIRLATSVNIERPGNAEIEQKLLIQAQKNIDLTCVVTPSVIQTEPQKILSRLQLLGRNVEFLRYSPAISCSVDEWDASNQTFGKTILNLILESRKHSYDIHIHNEDDIRDCIDGKYDPRMSGHVFISPDGRLNIIEYDKLGREYFQPVSIREFKSRIQGEKLVYRYLCHECKYYKRCYAEHLKRWDKKDDCCGCRRLLKYYEENLY